MGGAGGMGGMGGMGGQPGMPGQNSSYNNGSYGYNAGEAERGTYCI